MTEIIVGIIGGVSTIVLYLIQKACTYFFQGSCLLNCYYGKHLLDNHKIKTLNTTYIESPGIENTDDFVVQDKTTHTWTVNIPRKQESSSTNNFVHIFKEFDTRPTSGKHFLSVNIKNISNSEERISLFVRRWTGKPQYNRADIDHVTEGRLTSGVYDICTDSYIDDEKHNVDKEQVGIMIEGLPDKEVICELTDVYYGEHDVVIKKSCCKRLHCWYRFLNTTGAKEPSSNP